MGLLTAIRKFRYPVSTDVFNPPLHFKQLADDVDAWTGNQVMPIVTDASDRDTKFPSPAQGFAVFRRDLGVVQRYYEAYNASTNPGGKLVPGWKVEQAGLVPIRPSSVVGATVLTGGLISISASASVSVNGCFIPEFENYVIKFNLYGSVSLLPALRWRANGVDNTNNTVYYMGYSGQGNTGGSGGAAAVNQIPILNAASLSTMDSDMEVYSPQRTRSTRTIAKFFSRNGTSSTGMGTGFISSEQTDATSFDGFTLFPSSGLLGGTIRIYGYSDMIN